MRRSALTAATVILLGGCGSSSTTITSTTPASAPATTSPAAPAPAIVHDKNPAVRVGPPSQRSHQALSTLRVARRFVEAYLVYQTGRASQQVESAIAASTTPQFGGQLLSQPVSIPPTRKPPAPGRLVSLVYAGEIPSVQQRFVTATYVTAHSRSRLTIHLEPAATGWLVSNLG